MKRLYTLKAEAALNAIQSKYPQVFKTNDRLLLKPDSETFQVGVGPRDFMIFIKSKVLLF